MDNLENLVKKYIKPGYEYEVFFERVKKLKIEVSNEQVENVSSSEERGIGIRVLKDKRLGFSYTSFLGEEEIKDTVEKAMEMCEIQEPDEANGFIEKLKPSKAVSVYDEESLSIPLQEKMEIPVKMEKYAKELDKRIVGVRKSTLTEVEFEVRSFNSFGVEFGYRGTSYTSMIATLGTENDDSAISWEFRGARRLKNLNWKSMVEDAVFKTVNLLHPSPFETRSMPVVFFRESFAMLLDAFSPMFLGDYLVKGKTLLKDKVNEIVASEKITLVDDGSMEEGFSTFPYDAEGVPTRKNLLIDKGVFKGFLHSLYTARKSSQEPTGNSVRGSYKELPSSGTTNFYLEKGNLSFEELLSYYDEVFLVLEVMGLHTVDTISGDFSLGCSGILYKKGKKDKTVRGITVAGNILDLLKNVEEVGNDLTFYGSVGSPSVLVKKLTLGGG
ncbi:TldD/PmbA family protein [Aquifex aeolicus]|uniref:Peptide maturation n=1 Tax=Aquifex aeolicus (strain VF5) TaxID=224324 RepID=O67719_AQUAE|nr:metallopeptidase TldD-related protein [Aquifex aeolicus]AAC07693.1 peptide maturation [Aquifex aeolicus VF5]